MVLALGVGASGALAPRNTITAPASAAVTRRGAMSARGFSTRLFYGGRASIDRTMRFIDPRRVVWDRVKRVLAFGAGGSSVALSVLTLLNVFSVAFNLPLLVRSLWNLLFGSLMLLLQLGWAGDRISAQFGDTPQPTYPASFFLTMMHPFISRHSIHRLP